MQISKKNLVFSAIVVIILIVLLAILADWHVVFLQLKHANLTYLSLGTLLLVLGFITYAIRWQVLIIERPSFMQTFHAANAGSMVNMLLPLRPGDAARILMLGKRDHISLINVTTSIVVERWYEQIMRVSALGGAIVFGVGLRFSWLTMLGSVLYLLGMFLLMIWMVKKREWVQSKMPKWIALLPRLTEQQASEWIHTLLDGLEKMAHVRSQGLALLWSIISWFLFWGYHYLCLLAIQPGLDPEVALGLSLGSLALVPPSATTLPGVYQVSLIVPLSFLGYNRSLLASYAILLNALEMIVVMALGLWGSVQAGISLAQLIDSSLLPVRNQN